MSESNQNENAEEKTVKNYTREELLALPVREWDKESEYDSLLLLPDEELHDSGYSIINIIGVIKGKPVEIAANYCDDIEWKVHNAESVASFIIGQLRMDCMPESKAIRVWNREKKFIVQEALSSTTVLVCKR